MNESKLSFKESIGLVLFGIKTANKLIPRYFPCMLARSIITALQPLTVLFFSAQILNELSGMRDTGTIIMYVTLTIGITFTLSTAKVILTREIESHAGREQTLHYIELMQAERFSTIDFCHTEDSSVSETLAQMLIHARGTGRGLYHLFYTPELLTSSLFTFIFAVIMIISVLAGSTATLMPMWLWLALIAVFIAGMMARLKSQVKEKNVLQEIIAKASEVNTTANYYSDYIKADKAAKDLRIYNQSGALHKLFAKSYDSGIWITFSNFGGIRDGFMLALLAAIGGGFYLAVGYSALGNAVPVGSILQVVGAVTAIATAVGELITYIGLMYNNAPFLQPVADYLSLGSCLQSGEKTVPLSHSHEHKIEFRNVSFRYPGSEAFALRNVNLELNPRERLAIVGVNGSGKTTLIKLLCRLYEPTQGEILLDGANILEYDYSQYIALLSVVFQDFALFPLSIGQNVAVSGSFDAQRVRKCLDDVGFSERLGSLPDGPDTILFKEFDDEGVQISGGEAQKIALARALYKDAPLVVMDEPTAALDPIAEHEIYTNFDKTIGDRTAVFISHRLSSCIFCARVAVMDAGELVQLGAHNELLADSDGLYHKLWRAQADHYV